MKNFFNDSKFQEELRQTALEARTKIASIGSVTKISPGNCFLFDESDDLPVRWAAVLSHKDNPALWFLVAADEFSQVGTCDIEIPASSPMAPLVLRCNVGFWAHEDDVDFDRYVGCLDSESVADVKSRLAEMVLGGVPMTEHGVVAEANDDYREWIAELSEVSHEIETTLQAEKVSLPNAVFDTSYIELSLVAESRQEYGVTLAADANGPSEPIADPPPALVLESSLPGQLLLQQDGDAFDLVYFPVSADDQPPRLEKAASINVKEGKWAVGSDGICTWSQSLVNVDDHVSFIIAGTAFDIAVS